MKAGGRVNGLEGCERRVLEALSDVDVLVDGTEDSAAVRSRSRYPRYTDVSIQYGGVLYKEKAPDVDEDVGAKPIVAEPHTTRSEQKDTYLRLQAWRPRPVCVPESCA